MGFSSYVYGYIAEANQNPSGADVPFEEQVLALQKYNEMVIDSLPAQDDWPPLSRRMFGLAPSAEPMIAYWGRPIHFAAGLKEIDSDIGKWLDKFENLLRRLYWDRVQLHIEFGLSPARSMTWEIKRGYVHVFKGGPPPPVESTLQTSMEPEELEYRWPTHPRGRS
ncbi:hypothetical protein ACFJIS_17745 [Variovorax boronicumulans]|uniref:hypothetical protein n=1 Tax=Variovorax boronicumulans TaxID=436515 RepID=UPI0036F44732